MRLLPSGDRRSVPFLNDGRVDVEVAVADPGGPHAPIDQSRPGQSGGAVAITLEIIVLDAGQLGLSGNLRDAFVLDRAFVLPAENEGNTGILYEVLMLARLGHRIKKEFPPVRDGDIDHCRLWGPLRADTCLDGPGLGAHEGQQLGWGEGVMMFGHGLIVPDGQPFGIRGNRSRSPWAEQPTPPATLLVGPIQAGHERHLRVLTAAVHLIVDHLRWLPAK